MKYLLNHMINFFKVKIMLSPFVLKGTSAIERKIAQQFSIDTSDIVSTLNVYFVTFVISKFYRNDST